MKATVIRLTESSRKLFEKMHFPEIPTEAKFIAFGEDGECDFLSELQMPGQIVIPKMVSMLYYEVENLGLE